VQLCTQIWHHHLPMTVKFHWDDARVLLALARTGNASLAAAALGVSPPTIGRRLRALEAATGGTLAQYRDGQLVLTASGKGVVAAAERMELAASEVGLAARAEAVARAPVRVTAIASIAQFLVHRIDALLAPPKPAIELVVSSQAFSLPRGEADIALRMGRLPRAEGLRCRRLGTATYALYRRARKSKGERSTFLNDVPTAATHGHPNSAQAQWVEAEASRSGAIVSLRISDPFLRLEACAHGLGAALLPCFQGDATAGLERIGEPIAKLKEGIFLLAHPDTLARREVRGVFDAIVEVFRDLREQ
jgi:DNA-binding transcriptional LysR family regulator